MSLVERPVRILSVLNLAKIADLGDNYILTAFMGTPLIIHPSGGHVLLGVSQEVLEEHVDELAAHGVGDNIEFEIYKAEGFRDYMNELHTKIRDTIRMYEGLPTELHVLHSIVFKVSVAKPKIVGEYWRADALPYIFASEAGLCCVEGYSGSYREVLLRELHDGSVIGKILTLDRLNCVEELDTRKFYKRQMASARLAADYKKVEGIDYPLESRLVTRSIDFARQKKIADQENQARYAGFGLAVKEATQSRT